MKKFLSLFLVLTMVLSLLTLPTMAAGDETATPTATPTTVVSPAEIGDNATVTYDGKTYSVIRTAAEFLAITNNTNYILANDITLPGTLNGNTIKASTNYTINGNGYSVTFDMYNDQAGKGLFTAVGDNSTVNFVNITFNVSGKLAQNSTGVLIGTAGAQYPNSTVNFDTVVVNCMDLKYVHTNATQGAGIFYAKVRTNATFKNCLLTGTFTSTQPGQGGVGGYIGLADFTGTTTIKFENCKATGTYNVEHASTQKFGVFVGLTSKANFTMQFDNCEFDGTINGKGARNAAFVADSSQTPLIFNNCSLKGNLNMNAGQSGGFVGLLENSTPATFNNCTADATVVAGNNRVAPFVGQAYCSGTVTFNNCFVSGVINSNGNQKWVAGFMGVAGGSWSGNGGETVSRQNATVNFNNCDADVVIFSASLSSAYVGSNGGGNPKITYDNCANNATVYGFATSGVWYGGDEAAYGSGAATVTVNGNCTNNAKVYAVTLFDAEGNVTAEALADGSYAYAVAQAQAANGITTNIVGQTIGKDATPKFGGKTVYKFDTNKVGTFYSNNAEYVYTLTDAPKAYVQYSDLYAVVDEETSLEYDAFNTRVIIAVSEAKLAEVATANITLTFKKGDEVVKTKTFGNAEVNAYYAVYAGDQIAQAADGYVLVAVTVTGIPTAEWNQTEGTVSVTMNVTDANGDPIPEYTLA